MSTVQRRVHRDVAPYLKFASAASVVQNPTISLDADVAVTKRAIAAQTGSVILVGLRLSARLQAPLSLPFPSAYRAHATTGPRQLPGRKNGRSKAVT